MLQSNGACFIRYTARALAPTLSRSQTSIFNMASLWFGRLYWLVDAMRAIPALLMFAKHICRLRTLELAAHVTLLLLVLCLLSPKRGQMLGAHGYAFPFCFFMFQVLLPFFPSLPFFLSSLFFVSRPLLPAFQWMPKLGLLATSMHLS